MRSARTRLFARCGGAHQACLRAVDSADRDVRRCRCCMCAAVCVAQMVLSCGRRYRNRSKRLRTTDKFGAHKPTLIFACAVARAARCWCFCSHCSPGTALRAYSHRLVTKNKCVVFFSPTFCVHWRSGGGVEEAREWRPVRLVDPVMKFCTGQVDWKRWLTVNHARGRPFVFLLWQDFLIFLIFSSPRTLGGREQRRRV